MKKIQMHRETCKRCGYEGYDDDDTVSERDRCPKCGAVKIYAVNDASAVKPEE